MIEKITINLFYIFLPFICFSQVRIVPVSPTPFPEFAETKIVFPRAGSISSNPVSIQIRVDGYPLGSMSQFNRAKRLLDDPMGQSLRIIIDNNPFISKYVASEDSFDEDRAFYDKIISFELQNLSPGEHVMRTYLARSYGEALRAPKAFSTRIFFVGEKKRTIGFVASRPLLTYNEPQGIFEEEKANPILLDFILTNVELSEDGYKVRLRIDNQQIEDIDHWSPYYIYGLSKGSHSINIQLIDKNNQFVEGPYNNITREVIIK
ncbi:MAG: hypothetical protein WDZ28_05440 [Simkaniaceae bacterium]